LRVSKIPDESVASDLSRSGNRVYVVDGVNIPGRRKLIVVAC